MGQNSEIGNGNVNFSWDEALLSYEQVMSNGSEAAKMQATVKLARMLDCAPPYILSRTIPILMGLLGSPPSSPSSLLQEAAAYCLKCMACNEEQSLATLFTTPSTIASLIRILQNSDGGCQRHLIKWLWGLVTYANDTRIFVFVSNGLEIVINLLHSCNDNMRRFLLEIVTALALEREVRRALVNLGELHYLVEAARCGSMLSRERAAQAIGLLGVTRRARRILVTLGAIPALADLLREGDTQMKIVAANALGIIFSHVDYIPPVAHAGVIPLYAELLRRSELGKEITEDVFCILAVAEVNAVEITQQMVRILQEDDVEAKAAAADILWDLAGYKHSVSVIHSCGGIPILIDLLKNGNTDIKEKVSGAIAQLSYDKTDRTALANGGAIPCLIEMLQDESEELKDNAAEALINFFEDPLQHDLISDASDMPAFQSMQSRLVRIRAADQQMIRSLRNWSIGHLARNSSSL